MPLALALQPPNAGIAQASSKGEVNLGSEIKKGWIESKEKYNNAWNGVGMAPHKLKDHFQKNRGD